MRTLAYILLLFALISCEKEDKVVQFFYEYLNSELKSDYSFQAGSYWVYQDQAMNFDSVVLLNVETGFTSTCPKNSCARREFIKLNFESTTQRVTYNHYLLSQYIKYNGGGNWGQDGQPIFIIGKDEGYAFNGLIVGERIDSLILSGETFYDVKKMSVIAGDQYQNEFEYNMDFYFVPKIGLIKFVEYNTHNGTSIWELKRYKIEKTGG